VPVDLYVCRTCKGSKALVAGMEERVAGVPVAIHLVRCQGICRGAVAGFEVDGELTWFRRLRGKKVARSLAKLARRGGRGPIPKRLVAHHVAKRDGRQVKR
jgi:hypothetical protein